MESILAWLIKSMITSGVLYGYYHVVLRNKPFHRYNRFYLLATTLLSVLLPFMHFNWFEIATPQTKTLSVFLHAVPGREQLSAGLVLLGCSLAVSIVLLSVFMLKIRWVLKIKAKGTCIPMQGFNFIETAVLQAAFSFLNNLFWKKSMPTNDLHGEKIFKHELVHIRQKHSYDKLFCQLLACICWQNPFYWLIQKELNIVHEFLADENSIEKGDAESFACMLLHVHSNGNYLNPSHPFFNSAIQRRLTMIVSLPNSRSGLPGRVGIIPVGLVLVGLVSISLKAQQDPLQIIATNSQKRGSLQHSSGATGSVQNDDLTINNAPGANRTNVQYKAFTKQSETNTTQKSAGSDDEQSRLREKQHAEKLAAEKAARR